MRLHPLSVLYRTGSAVARLAWVAVIVTLGSASLPGVGALVAGGVVALAFVAVLAYQVAYYERFDYDLTGDTLDIRSGVLSRRTREIPLRRVQNVDVSRDVVQRALGIAQVDLETAGGSETEASLRYVGREEAERLRREISRRKRGETDEADEPDPDRDAEPVYEITPTELALYGVTEVDLRLLGLASVLLPVLVPSLADGRDPLLALASAAPLLLGGLVTFAVLASAVGGVTQYYGFRLWRDEEELRYERGLFQRYSGTIPLDKVQTVAVEENVLARRLGYASLSIETAGYAPGDSEQQAAVPLSKRERVLELARSVEAFDDPAFECPPARARTRYAARYALVVLALAGVAYAVATVTSLSGRWYLVLALLALVPVAAHLKWVNLGYDLQDGHVLAREGFWTRTTRVVPYDRVQTVIDSRTVFQRRRRLATLVVDTAGTSGISGRDARLLDIDGDRAGDLREEVARRLGRALG